MHDLLQVYSYCSSRALPTSCQVRLGCFLFSLSFSLSPSDLSRVLVVYCNYATVRVYMLYVFVCHSFFVSVCCDLCRPDRQLYQSSVAMSFFLPRVRMRSRPARAQRVTTPSLKRYNATIKIHRDREERVSNVVLFCCDQYSTLIRFLHFPHLTYLSDYPLLALLCIMGCCRRCRGSFNRCADDSRFRRANKCWR